MRARMAWIGARRMLRERAQTESKTGIDRKCKEIMGKIINPAA